MALPRTIHQNREFAFSEHDFRFIVNLVNEQTGIVLASHKQDMVYSRLARRLRALGLRSFAEYCDLVKHDTEGGEIGNLVNAITTNLTSFFREEHHFRHLHDAVLAPLVRTSPAQKRLRIWSAGCSSGMEPYSIAMTIQSALRHAKGWDARILATDIDTNMLATGEGGEYPLSEYEHIPSAYRGDVHKNARNKIEMAQELKDLIAFKPLNLLEKWPMRGSFNAVFCRNVVIYFDKETQKTLFSRIADQLQPDGWLYIGHSENLFGVSDRFELVGRTIYRKVR